MENRVPKDDGRRTKDEKIVPRPSERKRTDVLHPSEYIIFIVGPTASGKSEVAYLLAGQLRGEIVSCDSMLIYKEPSVITAKPSTAVLAAVKHHFVGNISVERSYNVFDYYNQARKQILELHGRGVTTIVCGGSGLYVKALCDGIFEDPGHDELVRRELTLRAQRQGLDVLHRELCNVDPQAAAKISISDARRIIRALEVYYTSGMPISRKQKQAKGLGSEFPVRIFGLRLKRTILYDRINARTEKMFEQGAVYEVKELRKRQLSITAQKIIGLQEIGGFLDGRYDRNTALELMKKNTRNFAKRQMTWFRGDKRIIWIDRDDLTSEQVCAVILKELE